MGLNLFNNKFCIDDDGNVSIPADKVFKIGESSQLTPAEITSLIENGKRKDNCLVATTENIVLSDEQTIDGVLTSANRVLVKDQTDQTENGIYVSAVGAWARSADANIGAEILGAAVKISQGTANPGKQFQNSNSSVPDVGTDNITFVDLGTIIAHNDTSGKDTGDFRHLTPTQKTKATQSATENLDGLLSQSDWKRFNDKMIYQELADEAGVAMPTGKTGFGFVMIGDNQEWAKISFSADGTVTLIQTSSDNVVTTDTDAKFCILTSGGGVVFKNRLGSALTLRFDLKYS